MLLRQQDFERIRVEVAEGIATLTLDRPVRRNAVDDVLHSELAAVFPAVRGDPAVRVAVLTGAGTAFCVGGDSGSDREFTTSTGLTPIQEAALIVENLLDLEKPVIAAVNGDAFGLGAVLATLADVAFVARSARIGDRHVAGGVTAGNGTAALWPVLVGVNRAKHLLLNGTLLSADRAVEIGLLHELVDDGATVDAAKILAERWATLPQFALRSTKTILNLHLKAAAQQTLRHGLALEEQSMAEPEFAAMLARRRGHDA